MGGVVRMMENQKNEKEENVNDLVVGVAVASSDNEGAEFETEVTLSQVFPDIVKKIKLRKTNYTGDKKEIKAFFNTFKGEPQVTFKYGKEYCVFKLDVATSEEVAYNLEHNFK